MLAGKRVPLPGAAAQRDHVLRLSELLRETLRASERSEHELCEEFALVCAYLRIEESRRPAHIAWSLRLEPGCEAAAIPSLLLLPLVENATTHGGPGTAGRLQIDIAAVRARGGLLVTLTNSCEASANDSAGTGLGLRNVRERLATHYRDDAALRVRKSDGRFEAEIEFPWSRRLASRSASA